MHGTGNDFVVIDQITENLDFSTEWVSLIADRKLGVGCDQLLLLLPPRSITSDFFYRIFNVLYILCIIVIIEIPITIITPYSNEWEKGSNPIIARINILSALSPNPTPLKSIPNVSARDLV